MNEEKRNRLVSLAVTIVIHALVAGLLLWYTLDLPPQEEESGVLLLRVEGMGSGPGEALNDPEAPDMPEPAPAPAAPAPAPSQPSPEPPAITQNTEPAPSLPSGEQKKREEAQKQAEANAKAEAERQAKLEAERKAREEAERKAREEAERKRKEAEQIASQVGGLFTQGTGGAGGESPEGSAQGNNDTGAAKGTPGWGTVDLGGRGLKGSLPKPVFNVNASGVVVVRITVNAMGNVMQATVQPKGTTTANMDLRKAACDAALRTKFVRKDGSPTMTGTITYRFDSNN